MKINKKNLILSSITVLISVLIIFSVAKAGSLTPPGAPAGTFYTLDDIYTRLTTNATATAGNHSLSPSAGPAGTMHTLADIYGAIPTIDPTKVLTGTTYLGIHGSASASSGGCSLTDNGDGTITDCKGTIWLKNKMGPVNWTTLDSAGGSGMNLCQGLLYCNDGTTDTKQDSSPGNCGNHGGVKFSSFTVPTINQLVYLINYDNLSAPPVTSFPNIGASDLVWSLTSAGGGNDYEVNFANGNVTAAAVSSSAYAFCIRD